MDRIYLDINATAPLAPAVKSWLARGDVFWANPASQHSSGKRAAYELELCRDDLFTRFSISEKDFEVFYHSGVSEAVNNFVLSWALSHPAGLFVYSPLDHACVLSQLPRLKRLGVDVIPMVLTSQGELNLADTLQAIRARGKSGEQVFIQFTWVHNEIGVVWPLEQAVELKHALGALVHVDAAQAVGKTEACFQLRGELDFYSFSAHKVAGLKGHGWSFQRRAVALEGIVLGGGQQSLRSGTLNVMGATALRLALQDLAASWHPVRQRAQITRLRTAMGEWLQGRGTLVAAEAQSLNLNTVFFVLNSLRSDQSLPLFDLAGLEISAGAACSSGAAKAGHVLEYLGYRERARHGLRLSLPWWLTDEEFEATQERLKKVFLNLPVVV